MTKSVHRIYFFIENEFSIFLYISKKMIHHNTMSTDINYLGTCTVLFTIFYVTTVLISN